MVGRVMHPKGVLIPRIGECIASCGKRDLEGV